MLPALALVGLFVYYPVVENVRLSLFQWNAFSTTQRFVGLDNYVALTNDPVFWRALANNIAYAVVSVIGGGRIVVAPPGLPGDIRACLERAMARVLTGAELRASSRRALDPADAESARADVEHAARLAPGLVPAVRVALARLRGR